MLNNLRYLSFVCSDRNFFCFASTKMTRKKITLSFSGCGFMGIYHTGVIRFLRECEDYIEVDKAAGCSAGAMAAVGLLCRPFDRDLLLGIMDVARATRAHPLGPLNPRFSLAKAIRRALTHMLPSNAHEMCRDRLRLSVTRCYDGKGVVLNNFASREELIDAVVCSSFVPFISGIVPPLYRNTYYWDGFLTDNLPIYDERSITVSPFSGESDICPLDASSAFLDIYFSNHHIRLTAKNFFRFSVTLYPSSPEILEKIYWEGYQDARRYIKDIILGDMDIPRPVDRQNRSAYHESAANSANEGQDQPRNLQRRTINRQPDPLSEEFGRASNQFVCLLHLIKCMTLPWILPLEVMYVIMITVVSALLHPRRAVREGYLLFHVTVAMLLGYDKQQRNKRRLRHIRHFVSFVDIIARKLIGPLHDDNNALESSLAPAA
ncbi:patatin-like phospholipase domain-containing protein 2 isoform X1 [Paramacrobiotus metropolitanus]|uniref:patatin-like phospholipase domain-containing protein 2 isoform X1 n=1 Tax=Paramacrobiotus metropolitanus TaxID=2943436 RepID=UPI0024459E0D|nr:patatin-like phospholipase domain-containing protein 2 isoform X1 [Paramacrobiotus metropolitanus]